MELHHPSHRSASQADLLILRRSLSRARGLTRRPHRQSNQSPFERRVVSMDNRKPSIPGGSQTQGYLPIVAPRASHAVDFFTTPEDLCRMAPPATSPVTATTQSPNCTLRRQLVDKNDQIHLRRSASGYALRRFPPHTSIDYTFPQPCNHERLSTPGQFPSRTDRKGTKHAECNSPRGQRRLLL